MFIGRFLRTRRTICFAAVIITIIGLPGCAGYTSSESVKELVINKVTILKKDHPESYYVVAQIKNDNDKVVCDDTTYTVNLYDDNNKKLGAETDKLPVIFPREKLWFLSNTIDTDYVSPSRAEIKIKPKWKPYDSGEWLKGKVLEAKYMPDPRTEEAKMVGTYKFPVPKSKKIGDLFKSYDVKINAVLLNSAGNPIDAYYYGYHGQAQLENDSHFEIWFAHAHTDVASFETSIFEWPGKKIVW